MNSTRKSNALLSAGGSLLNIIWLVLFGWWLCLSHIAAGIVQCVSIIGIPVGIANFKIAAIALWPVGRRVVSVEMAQQARIENAPPLSSALIFLRLRSFRALFAPAVRRYTYNSNLLYHLRILIALIGTTAVPRWLGIPKADHPANARGGGPD